MSAMVAEQIEGLMHRYSPARVNVCAIRRDGELRWIVRDAYEALGLLNRPALAEFRNEKNPGHDAGMERHWNAAAFTLDVLAPNLRTLATDPAEADRLIAWMEHLEGSRRRDPLKRVWEMAEAAQFLDGDPGISTGFYELRDWLHRSTWLDFDGTYYKPSALAVEQQLLTVRKERIPNHDELYPTVLVTERGMRALHERLGGIARLDLDHHHPLLPGMSHQ